MGVWDDMVAARAVAYDGMQVWDSAGEGYIRFDAAQVGASQLGHIVENRVLLSTLYRKLQALQGW